MIEVNDESGFEPAVGVAEVSELAAYVLDEMRVHPPGGFVGAVRGRGRDGGPSHGVDGSSRSYRRLVISDGRDPPRPLGVEPKPGMLGDIVVCPAVAKKAGPEVQACDDGRDPPPRHPAFCTSSASITPSRRKKEMFDLQRRLLLTFLARKPHDYGSGDIDDIAPTVDDD